MKKFLLPTLICANGVHIFAALQSTPLLPDNTFKKALQHEKEEGHITKPGILNKITSSFSTPLKSGIDRVIALQQMQQNQKTDWLTYEKKYHSKEHEMLRDHQRKMIDLSIESASSINAQQVWTPETKESFFDTQVKKAIDLHKKEEDEWKALAKERLQEAKNIYTNHQKEIKDFEQLIKQRVKKHRS